MFPKQKPACALVFEQMGFRLDCEVDLLKRRIIRTREQHCEPQQRIRQHEHIETIKNGRNPKKNPETPITDPCISAPETREDTLHIFHQGHVSAAIRTICSGKDINMPATLRFPYHHDRVEPQTRVFGRVSMQALHVGPLTAYGSCGWIIESSHTAATLSDN